MNGNSATDGQSRWKVPPNDAMQALRLQRETDFLKYVQNSTENSDVYGLFIE